MAALSNDKPRIFPVGAECTVSSESCWNNFPVFMSTFLFACSYSFLPKYQPKSSQMEKMNDLKTFVFNEILTILNY